MAVPHPIRISMLAPFGIRPKGTLLARMLPLASALVRRGYQVQIVAPALHNPQDARRCEVYDGVSVLHTRCPSWPGGLGVLQQVTDLLRPALAFRPHLLHLFKPKGYGGLATLLARLLRPGLPMVVDTDDWEGWGGWNDVLPYPYAAKVLFAWQERDLPRRAHAVTVASRTLQSQVWGAGVPAERVFYLPNGIDPETARRLRTARDHIQQRASSSADTILLYTRFWEFDVPDVVRALVPIVQHVPAARLLVVGKGERRQENDLQNLARQAGIGAAIDYRGWVEPAHLPAVLATADVAMVPMNDTLINRARCSAKLLEILAAGIPMVAAQVGAASEYISAGRNGLLVPPADPAALAHAVVTLLTDPHVRQQLAAGTRSLEEQFAWDTLAQAAEQAYTYAFRAAGA